MIPVAADVAAVVVALCIVLAIGVAIFGLAWVIVSFMGYGDSE